MEGRSWNAVIWGAAAQIVQNEVVCVVSVLVTAAVSTIAAIEALHWGGASASAYGGGGRLRRHRPASAFVYLCHQTQSRPSCSRSPTACSQSHVSLHSVNNNNNDDSNNNKNPNMTSHMSVTKPVYYNVNTPGYSYGTTLTDMGSNLK